MAVDIVGRRLPMAVLYVNMNVFILVCLFDMSWSPLATNQLKSSMFSFNFFPPAGEKPYACPVCPRAFNQRVVLREHIRSHHSAPDTNYENSATPFYCTVCGNLFRSSSEIIQHLIEHSDANTESNRQPVVGM